MFSVDELNAGQWRKRVTRVTRYMTSNEAAHYINQVASDRWRNPLAALNYRVRKGYIFPVPGTGDHPKHPRLFRREDLDAMIAKDEAPSPPPDRLWAIGPASEYINLRINPSWSYPVPSLWGHIRRGNITPVYTTPDSGVVYFDQEELDRFTKERPVPDSIITQAELDRLEAGEKDQVIAKELGLTATHIRRTRIKAGIKRGPDRPDLRNPLPNWAIDRLASGEKDEVIAQELNCSESTVKKKRLRAGIKRRRQG